MYTTTQEGKKIGDRLDKSIQNCNRGKTLQMGVMLHNKLTHNVHINSGMCSMLESEDTA